MTTPRTPRRTLWSGPARTAAAGLALTAAVAGGLAGCSGSSSDEASSTFASGQEAPTADGALATDTARGSIPQAATGAAPAAPGAAGGATTSGGAAAVPSDIAAGADRKTAKGVSVPDAALAGRDVIYTADLTVQVDDVSKAASQIETAVRAAGGVVESSQRSTEAAPAGAASDGPAVEQPGRSAATLTLRIPPGDFTSVLDRIAQLGLVVDRNLSGKDVTEAMVDVKSRVSSARTSVERIRDLMDRAVTLRDVVALEGELSQREADLDALLAKQASLKNQTSLATVTVHLEPTKAAAAAATPEDRGFGAGLSDGWNAFSDAAVAGATVLGALVPFLAALLLLGPPIWWLALRIHRSAPLLRRKVSPIEPG